MGATNGIHTHPPHSPGHRNAAAVWVARARRHDGAPVGHLPGPPGGAAIQGQAAGGSTSCRRCWWQGGRRPAGCTRSHRAVPQHAGTPGASSAHSMKFGTPVHGGLGGRSRSQRAARAGPQRHDRRSATKASSTVAAKAAAVIHMRCCRWVGAPVVLAAAPLVPSAHSGSAATVMAANSDGARCRGKGEVQVRGRGGGAAGGPRGALQASASRTNIR